MKIWEKKFLTHFLNHFWLIEAKWRWRWNNLEKWIQFLNSPYQNYEIRLCGDFQENSPPKKTTFDPFCKTFLTNRGKNENEDEKILKNESSFWILHIKTSLKRAFHKNLRKKMFFSKFLTEKDILGQRCRKGKYSLQTWKK